MILEEMRLAKRPFGKDARPSQEASRNAHSFVYKAAMCITMVVSGCLIPAFAYP